MKSVTHITFYKGGKILSVPQEKAKGMMRIGNLPHYFFDQLQQ